jgi:cell division protein FtsA
MSRTKALMGDSFRLRTNGAKPIPVRSGLIAALDIGSSKIACLIGRTEMGTLNVLGSSLKESQGVRSGAVSSLDLAEESIRETVEQAEQLAEQRVQDVIIGVQCGQPRSLSALAKSELGGALVTDGHLRELILQGKAACREAGLETIQASPTGYTVDEMRGVPDPRGLFCDTLGVNIHAVAVRSGPLQNLRLAVERCHLNIARQIATPYASALSTLTHDEMQLGCTLIDMGAGTTSIAVFIEGSLVHVDSVPLGGHHVTSDIARMFSTPVAAAERIKSLYGSALGDLEVGTDMIEVPLMGEEEENADQSGDRIRRSLLTRVIQSRMEEIFGEVQSRLRKSGFDVAVGRRLVLTGGACQLASVRELAGRILNKQVRLGRPQTFPGLAAATAGPAYAGVLGLLISGATMPAEMHAPVMKASPKQSGAGIGRWFGGALFG